MTTVRRQGLRITPDNLPFWPGAARKHAILTEGSVPRRDGRVVEGARLESVYRGNSIQGSNPCLSASLESATCGVTSQMVGGRESQFPQIACRLPHAMVERHVFGRPREALQVELKIRLVDVGADGREIFVDRPLAR